MGPTGRGQKGKERLWMKGNRADGSAWIAGEDTLKPEMDQRKLNLRQT
jgi:hypothetical protein